MIIFCRTPACHNQVNEEGYFCDTCENVAFLREENARLRAELDTQHGIIEGLRMAIEQVNGIMDALPTKRHAEFVAKAIISHAERGEYRVPTPDQTDMSVILTPKVDPQEAGDLGKPDKFEHF